MANEFWLTFIIMAFIQAAISKPLGDANEEKGPIPSYRQSAEKFLLSTETVVMGLYDNLPELKTEFDTYLIILSDYKHGNNAETNTAFTKELLTRWFKLLSMIKAIQSPEEVEITKAKTTVVKSMPLKETPKDLLTPIEKQLKFQLNELSLNEDMTYAEKAFALLTKMAEWHETNDQESFASEANALKDQFSEDPAMPRLMAEYTRLKDIYMETFESNPSYAKLLIIHQLGGYLYTFKTSMQKDKKTTKSAIESSITWHANRIGNEEASNSTSSLKRIFDKLLADSKDQMNNDLKVKYLDKQLQQLRYNQHLTDTQKSLLLIIAMVEWDELHDQKSFTIDISNNFSGFFLEQPIMPKLLVEYLRLRKLYAYLLKTEQSYDTMLTTYLLGNYLKHCKADKSIISKDNHGKFSAQNLHAYRFWSHCMVKTCSDETFWQLLFIN